MQKSSLSTAIFYFVLCCSVLATYWQVSHHDFINFDDNVYIYENNFIQEGLSTKGVIWSFTSSHASNWHPITWISHMTDIQLFGLNAGRHHLINVLFHLLNSFLIFLFLNGTTKKMWPSSLVSLLFALHPLHVESVAWASERKDVLSTFFMLLTLISYSRYAMRPNVKVYGLAFCFFILGLMSKPMLVTLPFLFLLLDYWPLKRFGSFLSSTEKNLSATPLPKQTFTHLLYEKIPFFVATAFSCLITFLVQQQSGAVKSLAMMPFDLRASNAIVSYVEYLYKLVWPINLTILYPFPESIPIWKIATSLAVIITVTVAVVRARKKYPFLLVGWLWYLGTMIPVIGFVQVGVQSMADRYTYVPMIGIFIFISFGIFEWGKITFRSGLTLGSMIVLCFAALSWSQVGYWKDSRTLFKHAIDVTSNNYTAHNYLAQALIKQKRPKEAEMQYNKALNIRPNYLEGLVNLGVLLAEQGRTEEAYTHLIRASNLDPDNPKIQNNLGNIHKSRGELDRAISYYKKAIMLDSKYKEALFNLANTLEKQGEFSQSILYYQQILQNNPNFAGAHNGLGVALARSGRLKEALTSFKKALYFRADYQQAAKNLATAIRKLDDTPKPGPQNRP